MNKIKAKYIQVLLEHTTNDNKVVVTALIGGMTFHKSVNLFV